LACELTPSRPINKISVNTRLFPTVCCLLPHKLLPLDPTPPAWHSPGLTSHVLQWLCYNEDMKKETIDTITSMNAHKKRLKEVILALKAQKAKPKQSPDRT